MSVWLRKQHEDFSLELEFLASLPPAPENLEALDPWAGPGAPLDLLARDLDLCGHAEARDLIHRLEEHWGVTVCGLNLRERPGQRGRRAVRILRGHWARSQGLCSWYLGTVYGDVREPAHESDAA